MSENLENFLVDVSSKPDQRSRFAKNPAGVLAGSALTTSEQSAVLSGDSQVVSEELGSTGFELGLGIEIVEPRKAPSRRKAPSKRAPEKKKTPAKKKAPARKKAPAKKRPIRRAPAKRAPRKRTPTRRSPAKRAPAKKAPRKSTARKKR